MDNLVTIKGTDQVKDTIDGSNVTQERITKSGTFRSSSDQTSNICHFENCWYYRRRLVGISQVLELLVGNDALHHVGVNGTERIVGSLGMIRSRKKIGKTGLPDVGQANWSQKVRKMLAK